MRKAIVALVSTSALFAIGCGGSSGQSVNSNPSPTITSISPNSAMAGGAAFTLTINGTNFVPATTVNFNGTAPATTFVSATQLTAAVPAAAIASVGTAAVTVANATPGGGTSNAVNFTITNGANPVSTINSLSPSCGPKGQPALNPFVNGQLLVNGQNFVASSVVRWNGNDRPTTFQSSSQLTARISTSDISAAGTAAVTVFNPAPGGGSSNTATFTVTAGGVSPRSIAVDLTGKFAYVANEGCGDSAFGNVSTYSIDATTGVLASTGPPEPSNDEGGRSVAVDHFGKFAYVANWGEGDTSGSLSAYTLNATTGALTFTETINGACPGLCAPWSVAVDPSGKFAYVANEGGFAPTGVSMFTINATTGALTSTGTVTAGGRAVSVAVDPTGKFAYVTNSSNSSPGESNSVSMYTLNATTGALTSIGAIAAGTDPASVAVDPTGKFAYVTNAGSNDVSMYAINATTGALTSIGTIAGGTGPDSVAIDPTGKFAYVTNSGSNDVSMYSINTTSGALTSTGTIAAGSSPSSIAIHPSGNFAYVTNSGSNNASMYSIDATTGALMLIGTVGT
jgi:YVTN family beta-propeller protein